MPADIEKGIYPFKDIEPKLTSVDIGWLLETHEDGRGPIDISDVRQRDRKGLDLRGADLQRIDLSHFQLAMIQGGFDWNGQRQPDPEQIEQAAIHLEGAQLEEVNLIGAILNGVHLENAHLSRSHLESADLREAHLQAATLTQVYLNGADLNNAHLEEADLQEAHLESLGETQNTILRRTHLEGADLRGAYMENTFLFQANLQGADLREAHMKEAYLCESQMQQAQLQGTHLESANLRGVHLEGANLQGAHLENADLQGAFLEGANLSNAHLAGAKLQRSHLEWTNFQAAILTRADLRHTCLAGANLRQAYIEDASLQSVHLGSKRMTEADVQRIQQWVKNFSGILSPARLEGAFFNAGTNLEGIVLCENKSACSPLVDIHWGEVNLSVIEWSQVKMLGDEYRARQRQKNTQKNRFKTLILSDYQTAVRANRQLAVVLQSQGLNEAATRFAYRAQKLQRIVLRKQHKFFSYLFSWLLDLLAGYGYKPRRSAGWYIVVIFGFAFAYCAIGHLPFFPDSLVFSLTSFHGRGFFPGLGNNTSLHDPSVILASIEAVIGLLIEISFIATFTKRFFGS